MTFGGLSAGGEWRKKRPGKWLKWREGFFRVSGVSSFHTIHTVRGFECRVVRGCRRRRDSKKVTSGVRREKNLPIQGIDESWCGVRRLDAEEGSLTKKTWVQKSRRHRRRVTQSFPYFKIMQTFGGTATLHKQLGAHIGELPYRARCCTPLWRNRRVERERVVNHPIQDD